MQIDKTKFKKNTTDIMSSRRQARRLALQVFFANEFLHEDIQSVIERISASLDQEVDDFCRELLIRTTEHKSELEKLVLQNLRDWDIERVAVLDRSLILLALGELLFFEDIPVEVTINEAVEISKEFISNKSSRFINGILDTIYKQLQNENKLHKSLLARIPPKIKKTKKIIKGI